MARDGPEPRAWGIGIAPEEHLYVSSAGDALKHVWARRRLTIAIFFCCLAVGLLAILQLPKKYTAEAVLLLEPTKSQLHEGSLQTAPVQIDQATINSEIIILQLPQLAVKLVTELSLPERPQYRMASYERIGIDLFALHHYIRKRVTALWLPSAGREQEDQAAADAQRRKAESFAIKRFLSNLQVTNDQKSYTIRVRYTSEHPMDAAEVVNRLVEIYIADQREMLISRASRPRAQIVSLAIVPAEPSGPSLSRLAGAVILASAATALGFTWLVARFRDGFQSAAEVEHALRVDVIGEVPRIIGGPMLARRLVINNPRSHFGDAIRSICLALLRPDIGCPVFLVTSPVAGECKTTFTVGLAQTLALTGRSCLLIDADLRQPSLHRYLECQGINGLGEVLTGVASLEDVLAKVMPGPLSFLCAGTAQWDPLNVLGAGQLKDFLDSVRRRFDIVIIDLPPVSTLSDTALMLSLADDIIIVVESKSTSRSTASRAVRLLERQSSSPPHLVLCHIESRSGGVLASVAALERKKIGQDIEVRKPRSDEIKSNLTIGN